VAALVACLWYFRKPEGVTTNHVRKKSELPRALFQLKIRVDRPNHHSVSLKSKKIKRDPPQVTTLKTSWNKALDRFDAMPDWEHAMQSKSAKRFFFDR
jgi:hypothetical protein